MTGRVRMPAARRARPLPSSPGARETLRRALRLRCPRCGVTPLFASAFRMHEACARCGLRFEREQGYFVGAIYVNYALTAALCLGTAIGADVLWGASLATQLAIALPLAVVVPLAGFRHARSLWLAAGHLLVTADDAAELRRSRRRRERGAGPRPR